MLHQENHPIYHRIESDEWYEEPDEQIMNQGFYQAHSNPTRDESRIYGKLKNFENSRRNLYISDSEDEVGEGWTGKMEKRNWIIKYS